MDTILGWIGSLLGILDLGTGNYLISLLMFAVILEICLLPISIKQHKNTIKQATLRPKEMAIRKKYAGRNDQATQQKVTMEIQELYQKEGYNPMGGCLPLLIQFPILIALYNIVIDPLKYICGLSQDAIAQVANIIGMDTSRGTMAMLGPIEKMGYEAFRNVEGFTPEVFENMPNLTVFGILDLSVMPSECMNLEAIKTVSGWLVLLVPVLTFLSYFFSMKLTRKFSYQAMTDTQQSQMGCSNKMMDITMPLFSVFISFGVPAALGIYWIFKSLLGIVKQIILYYAIPLPKFTEEDYKAAEKEVFARADKSDRVEKSGRVVRSLHHIDDEDFEDTREAALKHKEALAAQEKADKEKNAPKRSGLFSGAILKKDDRKAEEKENNDKNDKPQDENKSED